MALTIELSIAISADRSTATLTDSTTYGTGGNPARSAVGVFAKAYKVDADSNATAITTTGNDSDPETDASWTFALSDDGYYKIAFAIIPDFDTSATYARYAAVFQPSTNKVYRSKQNSNTEDTLTNTTWFEEITDPATLANNKGLSSESANITSTLYLRVLRMNGQYEFATQLSDQWRFVDDDELDTLIDYNKFAMLLDAAEVADTRTEVLDGELLCRRIQSKFIDAN